MKKLFLILSVALFALGTVNAFAQEAAAAAETQLAGESLHHVMMQKFLEGGWAWTRIWYTNRTDCFIC